MRRRPAACLDLLMTPSQIAAVERTLEAVDVDVLVVDFYRRAFEADPDVAAMFTTDPVIQRQRFAVELQTIVNSIRDLEAFRVAAADLGARHRNYGVRAAHYRTMGAALLASLAAAAGDRWTPSVEEAWTLAYNLISEAMLAGAAEGRPSAGRSAPRPREAGGDR
jgi:hemoglobin-like flavoprotein